METVETKNRTITETYHTFFCDNCGTFIGISRENSDGYYSELGQFNVLLYLECCVRDRWEKKQCLCDTCREKATNEIYKALAALGFEEC